MRTCIIHKYTKAGIKMDNGANNKPRNQINGQYMDGIVTFEFFYLQRVANHICRIRTSTHPLAIIDRIDIEYMRT